MARQAAPMKKDRTGYSQTCKDEALALADRIGVTAAAKELGIHASQLYQWRTPIFPKEVQHQQSLSERERALVEENARLKRQLAEKSEELEIAKKPRCISRKA
jgi:transposase